MMEQRMILLLLNLLVIISCYDAASAFTAAFLPSTTKKLAWTSSQLHSANINTDNQNQNQIDLASNSKSNISSSSTISTTTSSQTISSYTKTSQSSTFRDIGSRGIDAGGGNGAIVNAHVDAQADSADADVDVDANANVDSMDVASERQLMEQCLDYQAYTLGPTHIETMKTLHNLATFMYKHSATHTPPSSSVQQEKDESKKLYSICYNQQKCHLGQFHADTLLTLYNLFIIYYNEGHYDVVKGLIFEDVLSATNDAAHGGSYYMDWNILDTMLNLAFAYHCGEAAASNVQLHKGHGKGTAKGTGALKEGQETAMKLYESFISSFYDYTTTLSHDENEHIQDPTHPNHYHYQDLLSAQHNLGVLYQNTGDYAKAKTIVEECYNCRLAVLGKAHHLTLGTMNNLAALCHKMGEYGRAKDLYCECYDVKRECLGEDHPDSELTFRNIQRLKEVFSF